MSPEDKQFLKNSLFLTVEGCQAILYDDDLAGCLEIDNDEYTRCIDVCLTCKYLFNKILENYYQRLNDKQLNYLLSYYYMQTRECAYIITNKHIDVNFRLKLMNYTNDKYYYKIAIDNLDKDDNPTIRKRIFDYLLKNTTFSFIVSKLKQFNDNELEQLYNIYYTQLFGNSKKYNEYFSRCLIFGNILRKKEKETLIKRMKTKTRHFDISHALLHINFDKEEQNHLQAIQLMYELRSA